MIRKKPALDLIRGVERFSDKIMRKIIWMRRRVLTPLIAVLQTAAFSFRHDA